jgi:hypothetical protein
MQFLEHKVVAEETAVQHSALDALKAVVVNHYENQSSIKDESQIDTVFQLALQGSNRTVACSTLERLIAGHFLNQVKFREVIRKHWEVLKSRPEADLGPTILTLVHNAMSTFEDGKQGHSLVRQLLDWCEQVQLVSVSPGDGPTDGSASTKQFGGTCFVFAAARSFDRRYVYSSNFSHILAFSRPNFCATACAPQEFTVTRRGSRCKQYDGPY